MRLFTLFCWLNKIKSRVKAFIGHDSVMKKQMLQHKALYSMLSPQHLLCVCVPISFF
jgi:hypothetical protein